MVSTSPNTKTELPAGQFEISAPIILSPGTVLVGAGKSNTVIRPSSSFQGGALIQTAIPPNGQNFVRHSSVRDLTLNGLDLTIDGLSLKASAETDIRNFEVTNCNHGVLMENSIVTLFDMCKINANQIGFKAQDRITTLKVSNTRIQASKQHNISIDGPNTQLVDFSMAVIESSGIDTGDSPGMIIGGCDAGVKEVNLISCYFEKNRSGPRAQIEIGNVSQGIDARCNLYGCFITAGVPGTAAYGVHLIRARPASIQSCDFSAHDLGAIRIDAASLDCFEGGNVGGNPPITGDGSFRYGWLDNG